MTPAEEQFVLETRTVPAWLLGAGLVGSVFAVIYQPPISMLYGCALFFLYAIVISCGIALVLKSYAEPKFKNSVHPVFARILFYTSPILPIFALLAFANARFDSTPAIEHQALVEFKFSRSTKQGMRYSVDVPAPEGMGGPLGETVTLPVSREVYDRVALQHTEVKFRVRAGWLKIAWRDGYEITPETLVPPTPR